MQGHQTIASKAAAAPASSYPLTLPWTLLAVLAGVGTGLATDQFLPGFAVFTLLVSVAITWRRGDPPIFPLIVTYQWTSITVGYWYEKLFGFLPGLYRPGDVDHAVTLALSGLLLLSLGIRLVYQGALAWRRSGDPAELSPSRWRVENLQGLFLLVVAAYAVDYLYVINTKALPGLDVILQRVLDLRQVLLATLLWEVFRRREGYWYGWLALAWAFIPRLGAYFSEFKSPLVLFLLVMAAMWRPWDRKWWPKSLGAAVKSSPVLALLLLLLLVWQGGLKRDTREAYDQGFVQNSPLERIELFVRGVYEELPVLFEDPRPYVESLVERVSYITFFSRVLEHVPEREAHADGELLKMALANSTMPRFLFPEKPVLPSDSYYTRRFAGVTVATGATSVSIGYMAEFYADWGLWGMWLSVFAYGAWIGLAAAVLTRFAPIPALHLGVMCVAFFSVMDFEHQFVKGFAALNASVVFTLLSLFLLRPWLTHFLGLSAAKRTEPAGAPLASRLSSA